MRFYVSPQPTNLALSHLRLGEFIWYGKAKSRPVVRDKGQNFDCDHLSLEPSNLL
jgi:hypothetical protein